MKTYRWQAIRKSEAVPGVPLSYIDGTLEAVNAQQARWRVREHLEDYVRTGLVSGEWLLCMNEEKAGRVIRILADRLLTFAASSARAPGLPGRRETSSTTAAKEV